MALVVGNENYDWQELEETTTYKVRLPGQVPVKKKKQNKKTGFYVALAT